MNPRRPSPFTVLLITVAASLVGLFSVRGLTVRYTPVPNTNSLVVSVSLRDASPALMEAEVTSRLEAALSGMTGCKNISSTSGKGYGRVEVEMGKGIDMDAARFEASTRIAHLRQSFPDGTSYPLIEISRRGDGGGTMYYLLRSPLPSARIADYARKHLIHPISSLNGVGNVEVYGASPWEWVIEFDFEAAEALGISGADIASAVQTAGLDSEAGMISEGSRMLAVRLRESPSEGFEEIPVGNVGGRIVRLGEIADVRYEESSPSSYMRFNGLNTVTMAVRISEDDNLIRVASAVRTEMSRLAAEFPDEMSFDLSYDPSEYVTGELNKIIRRTLLCLAILLAFSFLVSRSWRQLLILMSSLFAGLFISFGIYRLCGVPIHIYSLAGITVSFGIMIDTTILMTDHYARKHNRKAFGSLVAAVMTTVAALLMMLLLPENERLGITDFLWVIVINLTVSLAVSYFFVPALMDSLPAGNETGRRSARNLHRLARIDSAYSRSIMFGSTHKWLLILLLIIAFGIPVYLIPGLSGKESSWLKAIGSISGLFYRNMDRSNFYRQPERKVLYIRAGMLEGCTVHQLDQVMRSMENFLASFDEIDNFTTNVRSYDDAQIEVRFKHEYENSSFPSWLKSQVTAMAINFGGANWVVSGIDDNYFNNNIVSNYKSHRITLHSYNFDTLTTYAGKLVSYLAENKRVSGPEIWGSGWRSRPGLEYHMEYDREALAKLGLSPNAYYRALSSRLFSMPAGNVMHDGRLTGVSVKSSMLDDFDLWHVKNVPVKADSAEVSLSGIGNISSKRTEITISRRNQSYELNVCYDFIGSWQLEEKLASQAIEYMNGQLLPVGYKAEKPDYGWFGAERGNMLWLILLVILVIYAVLAAAFESLLLPLPVILMIPVSFIGLFLIFGLSSFAFDQGGFAAMVMLCGITVNAGIYLVHEFTDLVREQPGVSTKRLYIKAFRNKIAPISMTIVSTVLGLLPFLSDGPTEVFWFDFAIGTIAGLAMSVLAILFYLPAFLLRRRQ